MPSSSEHAPPRLARFEVCEPRLVLSANPAGDFFVDTLDEIHSHVENALDDSAWVDTQADLAASMTAAHNQSGVTYAHNTYGLQGKGQTVVVIDTGIAWDHPALGGGFGAGYRIVGGYDFAEKDNNPYDDGPGGFHGTHVAGIIGSNHATYTGVAPGVDLVALRVFNDQGAGYFDWVAEALQWVLKNKDAFENPITTINMSLGTNWNASTIPNWATLESLFAQIKAQGIFISVSAGNAFQSYQTPGLSYPAVSPHVVPVASVGSDGLLSGFSQRNDRVIAAPGQSIVSTVPDYAGNNNGRADDYRAASGTSMAAPYVAGASVLVREAMELVGYENITQDTIYNHLRDTADIIYDAATGAYYHRLNVQQALDAIVPDDEFGNSAAAAHKLGTLSDTLSLGGMINTLQDADYFQFTAAKSGTATLSGDTRGYLDAQWNFSGGAVTFNDDGSISFDVVAGQSYTLGVSTAAGIGFYDMQLELSSATAQVIDWGAIDYHRFADTNFQGEAWYSVTATRDGWLTVVANAHGSQPMVVELYDANMRLVSTAAADDLGQRADVLAKSGETYFIRAFGTHTQNVTADVLVANVVGVQGKTVTFHGSAGSDVFHFTAGSTYVASMNGLAYEFAGSSANKFVFAGNGGMDAFQGLGDERGMKATLRVGQSSWSADGYSVAIQNVEQVAMRGNGGKNTALLYDSAGDDTFVAYPSQGVLSGAGFSHSVDQFSIIEARAENGGNDSAHLYDSAGNDTFVSSYVQATFQGEGFLNRVRGFETVTAYSESGGDDSAALYDSPDKDVFTVRPGYAAMARPNDTHIAVGFSKIVGDGRKGGGDVAVFFDSAGDDHFVAKPNIATLTGDGFSLQAKNFSAVTAYAVAGGFDTAIFHNSPGNDVFIANRGHAALIADGYTQTAVGFAAVEARGGSGYDVAWLYDTPGNDHYAGTNTEGTISGDGYSVRVSKFSQINVAFAAGGYDTASVQGFKGNESFAAGRDWLLAQSGNLTHHITGGESITVQAKSQAALAALYNVQEADRLEGERNRFAWYRDQGLLEFINLAAAQAAPAPGHAPATEFHALEYVFEKMGGGG